MQWSLQLGNCSPSLPDQKDSVVSFDSEELILVDAEDQEIGFDTKGRCHDGEGILHRAFSVFVFNSDGQVLLQQRSKTKRLWPMYWSNTCCSHPRRGESMEVATQRRLQQELGFSCDVEFLYKFQYHASYEDLGSENELCWVYRGIHDQKINPNKTEIAQTQWLSPQKLDRQLADSPEKFTPWFKLEWAQVRNNLPHKES